LSVSFDNYNNKGFIFECNVCWSNFTDNFVIIFHIVNLTLGTGSFEYFINNGIILFEIAYFVNHYDIEINEFNQAILYKYPCFSFDKIYIIFGKNVPIAH